MTIVGAVLIAFGVAWFVVESAYRTGFEAGHRLGWSDGCRWTSFLRERMVANAQRELDDVAEG